MQRRQRPIPRFPDGLVLERSGLGLLDITRGAWEQFCSSYSNIAVRLMTQDDYVRELERVLQAAESREDLSYRYQEDLVFDHSNRYRFVVTRRTGVIRRMALIQRFTNDFRIARPLPRQVRCQALKRCS